MTVRVAHYLKRAGDHFESMQLLKEDEHYQLSSALLAIHSAIAYADALRVGLGASALASENHLVSIAALERKLQEQSVEDTSGLARFRKLIGRKSLFAYSDERISRREVVDVIVTAERFALWANKVGKELRIFEGEKDAA